ncbi:MAG: alpha-amylase family glycosyl hydrolase [Oscillospiraceae bacterium]|jgi:maltose alpha-D-glucosyltransferase/alpha-amylase|nr:alpha-amylase family glycosyl hydrolase [Oscillospiraceae bacterium]
MPKWLDNAIFYEIYPQSYKDTNGDGIGDLNGITEKLDYIKDLGCNALWLNPCFLSPFCDAGYDVADYCRVAPRYGSNDDLFHLFREAHTRGMHVILDLVPGHTSYQHRWFQESMKAEKNPLSDRYVWTNSVWEAPDGMECLRGISQRDGAVAVNFFSTQPALNYGFLHPEKEWQQPMNAEGPMATRAAIKDVMRFWLRGGCDGFRVDMAGSLVKHDDAQSSGTVALWQDFRHFLDREFPEAAMISEWGEPDKSLRGGFHMDFLLHFGPSHYNDLFRCEHPYFSAEGKGEIADFLETYNQNYAKTHGEGLICIPSGNHDMDRLARRLTPEEMKIAFAFLLSVPGAPFIYYGDEIGMRYVENLRSVEGGYERTGSRTPMQWDSTPNAGFSTAPAERLYIPQDPDNNRPTASAQQQDKTSLYHEVRRLISVRLSHPALQSLAKIEFFTKEGYPLVYLRTGETEKILVLVNPSAKKQTVQLSCPFTVKEQIYRNGGTAALHGSTAEIDGCTAAFFTV